MSTKIWWRAMCGIAVFNLCVLAYLWLTVKQLSDFQAFQLRLSSIYVCVCAFRSIVPRVDLERYCLFDSFLSSMVVGRSCATIAEVSFATQCALFTYKIMTSAGVTGYGFLPYAIVAALTIAQGFCWYSVCTLNHVGHAIENSLWTLTFGIIGVVMALCFPYLVGTEKLLAGLGVGIAGAFVMFMVTVDVPMYIRRFRDTQTETQYLSLQAGFIDALWRRNVTWEWDVWRPEVAWMTGYFSGAVWISMSLAVFS